MAFLRSVLPLLVAVSLSGCQGVATRAPKADSLSIAYEQSKQEEMLLQRVWADQGRLYDAGLPLLINNAPLCGQKIQTSLGGVFMTLDDLPPAMRDTASRLNPRLGHILTVLHVVPDSPVARAGLREGDRVIQINGENAPAGKDAVPMFMKRVDQATATAPSMRLMVERVTPAGKTETAELTVKTIKACKIALLYNMDSEINAATDGKDIQVNSGMIHFAESTQELALVVSHEMGHILMRHIDKQKDNATAGWLAGTLLDLGAAAAGARTGFGNAMGNSAAGANSVDFEAEADYVGLYLMARAGFKIEGAANFWRRMGVEHPQAIFTKTTHPTTPARFIAVDKTIAEILDKKKRGQPLEPNWKVEEGAAAEKPDKE
jgi:beta-barrel assembly-enhancing protease